MVDKTILVEDLAGDARNDCIFTNKDVILASPDGMYLWSAKAKSPIYIQTLLQVYLCNGMNIVLHS